MVQNQHNKTCEPALLALRQDIDKIDDQIISLLKARMEIVSKVGEFKKINKEKFFIRSNREADMIKGLVAKSCGSLSAITVISIWRKIITAANMHEQPLAIAICNPRKLPDYAYLVKSYYNDFVPICDFDNAKNTILELEKGEAQIAIFADPKFDNNEKSENWWVDLVEKCDDLQIFAKIPFVEFSDKKSCSNQVGLFAVAAKKPEKSSEDNSLFCLEVAKEISSQQVLTALKECGFVAKILKTAQLSQEDDKIFYLAEVEGFWLKEDLAVQNLSKFNVKILGHYAKSVKI